MFCVSATLASRVIVIGTPGLPLRMNQSWIYIRSIVLSIAIRMSYYDLLQNPLQLLIAEVLPPEQAAAAGLSTGEARVKQFCC